MPIRFLLSMGLLFALAAVNVSGQSAPEPILVDEYSRTPCDDFLGRLDAYLGELRSHPDSTGFIVLRNEPAERVWSVELESMINSHVTFRGFKKTRFEIVRADGAESRQFWRIPSGAPKPQIDGAVNGFKIPEAVTRPFILESETKFGMQICPEVDSFAIYSDFMLANPSARGNIVVRNESRLKARRKAARIIRMLAARGIASSRLRMFTRALQRPPNYDEDVVEYWYLP
jgi:hypothetical protein